MYIKSSFACLQGICCPASVSHQSPSGSSVLSKSKPSQLSLYSRHDDARFDLSLQSPVRITETVTPMHLKSWCKVTLNMLTSQALASLTYLRLCMSQQQCICRVCGCLPVYGSPTLRVCLTRLLWFSAADMICRLFLGYKGSHHGANCVVDFLFSFRIQ